MSMKQHTSCSPYILYEITIAEGKTEEESMTYVDSKYPCECGVNDWAEIGKICGGCGRIL